MKYLYLIGFIIWFTLSFFSISLVEFLTNWFSNLSLVFKIALIFINCIFIILGIHKIILSLTLFNNTNSTNFNRIASGYSLIGIIGLISSYFINQPVLNILREVNISNILTLTFLIFWIWILISGFILFPKSIRVQ